MFTPTRTPRPLLYLMWIIVGVSLLSPPLTFAFHHYGNVVGPQELLTLSSWGLYKGFVWQVATYLFVQSPGVQITFSLLLSLLFYMVLLWFAGSEIYNTYGAKRFFALFFGSGLFGGIIAALIMVLFNTPGLVYGCGPAIYALIVVWCMMLPELELAFLFLIRIKAKWLVVIVLGFSLVSNLAYGAFVPFFTDLSAMLFAYFFALVLFKLQSPFPITHRFDRFINTLGKRRW